MGDAIENRLGEGTAKARANAAAVRALLAEMRGQEDEIRLGVGRRRLRLREPRGG